MMIISILRSNISVLVRPTCVDCAKSVVED